MYILKDVIMNLDGTRIRVSFENISRSPIPEEYHYEFRNVILKKIQECDKELSLSIHDQWDRFFSFSGFLGPQWNTSLGLVFKRIDVVFASPDASAVSSLKNALLLSPYVSLFNARILVNSVRDDKITLEDGVTNLQYETLGEAVIKKDEKFGKTLHVGANDNIESSLENTIKRQYTAFRGEDPSLFVKLISVKQKKKAILKTGTISNSFIALRLRFSVQANERVHAFLLTQGIGHHRKMGFGTVGIYKERNLNEH
jgi:CRISPR-associated endoribonuclease Cas6